MTRIWNKGQLIRRKTVLGAVKHNLMATSKTINFHWQRSANEDLIGALKGVREARLRADAVNKLTTLS